MIDRRFIDTRLTVYGFAAGVPYAPRYGDQWIVSQAWGDSYPYAVVNAIAKYDVRGWHFTNPSQNSSLEVINLDTNEILRFEDGIWKPISSLGGYIYPFVVDAAYKTNPPENTIDNIGQVYIVFDLNDDCNVYKITGVGEKGRTSLGALALGQRVALRSGYEYKVASRVVTNEDTGESRNANYFTQGNAVPIHSLILSQRTQNVYLSGVSAGQKLISLTPQIDTAGQYTGTFTIVTHTFTADEIKNRTIIFPDTIADINAARVICFLSGSACVHGIDFYASRNDSYHGDYRLKVYWNSSSYAWYENSPREGEVGIFMYFKE